MDVDSKSKWVDKKNDDRCPQQSEKCEILWNFYNYIPPSVIVNYVYTRI